MQLITLDDVARSDNFFLALGAFIDDFKRSSDKYTLIQNPPSVTVTDKTSLCILAATVHKLTNDFATNTPDWVFDSYYVMSQPIFSHNTTNKEYQEFLKQDAPFEFASRNIFYSSSAIERV